MSITTELSRIQTNRNTIRAKLVELGLATNTDKLDALATTIENLVNRGAVSVEIKEGTSYTIPAGYHNGSGVVKAITDTEAEAETYKTQAKTVTPTKKQQSVTPDSGYYALESVTVGAIPDAYQDVTSVTAAAGDVLTGKVFVLADGTVTTGTMPNNGAVNKALDATTITYTIPKGYHSGSGKVTITLEEKSVTPTKSAQTITPTSGKVLSKVVVGAIPDEYQDVTGVTATADDVRAGMVFVDSDGTEVEGTIPDVECPRPSVILSLNTGKVSARIEQEKGYTLGGVVTETLNLKTISSPPGIIIDPTKETQIAVPAHHFALGDVKIGAIPAAYQDITGVTATADEVLTGFTIVGSTGWPVDGSMPNNGDTSDTIDGLTATSVTIPAGYTSGGTVSLTSDIEEALAAI